MGQGAKMKRKMKRLNAKKAKTMKQLAASQKKLMKTGKAVSTKTARKILKGVTDSALMTKGQKSVGQKMKAKVKGEKRKRIPGVGKLMTKAALPPKELAKAVRKSQSTKKPHKKAKLTA